MNFRRPKLVPDSAISLGIDIGSHAVKVMLAEKVGARVDIRGAGKFELPSGLVVDGVITNPKKFAKVLVQEIETYGQKPSGGVFSIPSTLAALRWISLPELEGDERRQAARFKVKRHLPFPVEDAYLDASAPETGPDGTPGQSLVVAVKRAVIDSRAEALELAGIEPLGAELEAQAILRVVERRLNEQSVLWRDASLTIIDVGGSNTHMYVVQNQRLQFIRGVKFGADVIAGAVSKCLDLPHEVAHAILADPETNLRADGTLVMNYEDSPMLLNVQGEMEKLTREFLRLLRYFRSLHPERSYAGILDHVILCGGMVGMQGFTNFMEQELGIRVERARPFAGMVAQLKKETFESVSNQQEAFTVVMGLALVGLGRSHKRSKEKDSGSEYVWLRSA